MQGEVAHDVDHLVPDELVGKPQIQVGGRGLVAEDDRVLGTRAPRQAASAQGSAQLLEPERTGRGESLAEPAAGDLLGRVLLTDRRVLELDPGADPEAVVRHDRRSATSPSFTVIGS
jgi:hypothetical protein